VLDLRADQDIFLRDPYGPNTYFPEDTLEPRDCLAQGSACSSLIDRPDIGFTKATASLPLNDEIMRVVSTAEIMISHVMTKNQIGDNLWSLDDAVWQLLQELVIDVVDRLKAVDQKLSNLLHQNINFNSNINKGIFVIALSSSLCAILLLFQKGLSGLLDRTLALTALVFQIPEPMLKELPALQRVVDTHGLYLGMTAEEK
jgi:hypothetical protein